MVPFTLVRRETDNPALWSYFTTKSMGKSRELPKELQLVQPFPGNDHHSEGA